MPRMVVVAGKGGTGRTTVAMGCALALAAKGRAVALAEVHGASGLAGLWGARASGGHPVAVAPGVHLFSLDAASCLQAYTADRLPGAPLAGALFRSRFLRAFLDGVPGMGDLLHLGFLHSLLAQGLGQHAPWDTVVLDAPPTGHGLAFTATARAMAEMTGEGPIHLESLRIAEVLEDPARTAHLVVTLPEALPVAEAVHLVEHLGAQRPTVAALVLNRTRPDPFTGAVPWSALSAALRDEPDGPALQAVAARMRSRLALQAEALAALGDLGPPVVGAPDLADPTPRGAGPLVSALAEVLA